MDTEEHPNGSEHRIANRVRSFLRAEIIHSNGNSRTECTVRDLSDTGARIEAPASVTVPEFFEFYIPLRNLRARARIMWRAGNELGIAFIADTAKPAPAPAPAADTDMRIKLLELEAETARLRAQMAEMQNMVNTLILERKTG